MPYTQNLSPAGNASRGTKESECLSFPLASTFIALLLSFSSSFFFFFFFFVLVVAQRQNTWFFPTKNLIRYRIAKIRFLHVTNCSIIATQRLLVDSNTTYITRTYVTVSILKLECPVEKLDYCVQGQGHSKRSECQWMFVWLISSETQNILCLVWSCSVISQTLLWKNWIAAIKVKVTAKRQNVNVCPDTF